MIQKPLFVFCLITLVTAGAIAQVRKTVTNSDLEGYRQARVAAERELREDYARLGFPSPEELLRRNLASQQEMFALSDRLKAERLERERIELRQEQMQMTFSQPANGYYDAPSGGFYWPTVINGRNGFGRRRGFQQQGYFAGGQFWPTGPSTPLRPLLVTPHPTPPHH